jgi:hypothetical protein
MPGSDGLAAHVEDARAPKTPARGGRGLIFMVSVQLERRVERARRHRGAHIGKASFS